jgi:hypothetical protein
MYEGPVKYGSAGGGCHLKSRPRDYAAAQESESVHLFANVGNDDAIERVSTFLALSSAPSS